MSAMIKCDRCGVMAYADSRSDKGAMYLVKTEYVCGLITFDLCKTCHRQLLTEFTQTITPEEYDDMFRTREDGDNT